MRTELSKSGKRSYKAWHNMKQRCQNPNNPKYMDYGGRGLSVCKEWQSFDGFYKDMGEPDKGMTLERIDNNKGYSRENCCWVDWYKQSTNRRTRRTTKSGIMGVCWSKRDKKWLVRLTKHHKTYNLGLYEFIEEAKKVRRQAELLFFGKRC